MRLKLVVACLLKNAQSEVLITERPSGKFMEGYWEFPGGKIEADETPEGALIREMKEELGISLKEEDLTPYSFISYPYEEFHALVPVFSASRWEGALIGLESQRFCWVSPNEISQFLMLPANLTLVTQLKNDKAFFS